jgi:hypothetical protein
MSFKRKVVEELFKNSFIVKNRKRLQNISEHEKQIDDVKRVDLTNEIYHIKKLKCIKN